MQLTAWTGDLLEKLTVVHLDNKYHVFCNKNFHIRPQKNRSHDVSARPAAFLLSDRDVPA